MSYKRIIQGIFSLNSIEQPGQENNIRKKECTINNKYILKKTYISKSPSELFLFIEMKCFLIRITFF